MEASLHPSGSELNLSNPLRPWGRSVVDLIPVEILSEIFLFVVQDWQLNGKKLMLVCWHWRNIALSIPGIHSDLRIRRATRKEVVQAFINGRKSLLDVIVDMNN